MFLYNYIVQLLLEEMITVSLEEVLNLRVM
jgi:hypothetical protein